MKCNICPRQCNTERPSSAAPDASGKAAVPAGFCGEGTDMRISRAALHFWEEPCISGTEGSGTVFFTGCNLRCIYCQNAAISENGIGKTVSPKELCDIFFDLKNQGAHNINLVTPTHFVPGIRKAILFAKESGFDLPFVYNSSGYESVETLKTLEGLIDIYLPDFKYMDAEMAKKYSHAPDYPEVAKAAIAEMLRQTGKPVFAPQSVPSKESPDSGEKKPSTEPLSKESSSADSEAGILLTRGVIVRHLLLPLGVKNAKAVISYLKETYGNNIYLSLMSQYTPLYDVPGALSDTQKKRLAPCPELHRKVTKREYEKVLQFCLEENMENVFIQEGDVAKESFIPPFPVTTQSRPQSGDGD